MSNYKGWTNRETWATVFVINNTEELYLFTRDKSATALESVLGSGLLNPEEVESIGDLSKVNWSEVAEACQS